MIVEEKTSEDNSSRCQLRISNTGHAYSRPDITSLGFTNDECRTLASRQRATNYLLYMYTDRGQPLLRENRNKSSRSVKSNHEDSWRAKSAPERKEVKLATLLRKNEDSSRLLNKRICFSAPVPRRNDKRERLTSPRRTSFTALQTEASIDSSIGAIIVRSLNQDLSPAARLERYLINLQREGYLTSASKERKKNCQVELDSEITPKGVVSLQSKFLPHPPVYLFERAVKDSPFNKRI